MRSIDERDIETPWGDPAAEYRGVRTDGTLWREVLIFGESIGYDGAPRDAGKEFDAIIDSLCFKWSR